MLRMSTESDSSNGPIPKCRCMISWKNVIAQRGIHHLSLDGHQESVPVGIKYGDLGYLVSIALHIPPYVGFGQSTA